MEKIFEIIKGAFICMCLSGAAYAAEKFDILPDLPEPLATAQAASVTTTDNAPLIAASNSIGQEPNLFSVVTTLVFVILLIYASAIIYAKLNKMGFHTFRRQMSDSSHSRVSVVSTTPLGGNKTLHVVELDGKRMLIGASQNSIQLLKDLGTYPSCDMESGEFSKIEIPNIRIPKIEIPRIEFPNLGFTKAFVKDSETEKHQEEKESVSPESNIAENVDNNQQDGFEISDIYEEGPDGIIDKLFQTGHADNKEEEVSAENEHSVDPDEYALYKKYL